MSLPKRKRSDFVPIAPFVAILKREITEQGPRNEQGERMKRAAVFAPDPMVTLAERIGMSQDWVYRTVTKSRWKWVSFDVADRVLVALNRTDLWYSDAELNLYYEGGVVEAADRRRPLQVAA